MPERRGAVHAAALVAEAPGGRTRRRVVGRRGWRARRRFGPRARETDGPAQGYLVDRRVVDSFGICLSVFRHEGRPTQPRHLLRVFLGSVVWVSSSWLFGECFWLVWKYEYGTCIRVGEYIQIRGQREHVHSPGKEHLNLARHYLG